VADDDYVDLHIRVHLLWQSHNEMLNQQGHECLYHCSKDFVFVTSCRKLCTQCTVPVCRHVPLCGGVNMPEDQKPHHQRSGELVSHP